MKAVCFICGSVFERCIEQPRVCFTCLDECELTKPDVVQIDAVGVQTMNAGYYDGHES